VLLPTGSRRCADRISKAESNRVIWQPQMEGGKAEMNSPSKPKETSAW
jgi:hypothetical protein